jgi:hypothetical protein
MGNLCEDIAQVRAQGLEVDNDNEPAPENVLTMNISVDPTTGLFQGQCFHWNGACQRKLLTNQKLPATFNSWSPMYKTMYEMWFMFFPLSWLIDVCIENTSKSLMDAGHTLTNLGELTRFLASFSLHFTYRHVVDDHNNLCYAVRIIEETWVTTRWALRALQFLLAVTEVNMYLCMRYFVWDGNEKMTLLEFRRNLAWDLINNPEIVVKEEPMRRSKRH